MSSLSDQELFAAVRANDEEALGILFLRYHDQLLRYGMKLTSDSMLVEDSIQELFIQLLQNRDRYFNIKNFKAYLFTAFRRDLQKKLQKLTKKRINQYQQSSPVEIEFTEGDLASYSEKDNLRQTLVEILNSLPWRQREALFLRYYNGLSTKEIAEVMGINNQTVLNTLYKGLKKVKDAASIIRIIMISFLLIGLF